MDRPKGWAMPFSIPPGLEARRRLGPEWATWLDRLPQLAAGLVDDWALTPDGTSLHGYCSLVLPVRTAGGLPAILKIGLSTTRASTSTWPSNGGAVTAP